MVIDDGLWLGVFVLLWLVGVVTGLGIRREYEELKAKERMRRQQRKLNKRSL